MSKDLRAEYPLVLPELQKKLEAMRAKGLIVTPHIARVTSDNSSENIGSRYFEMDEEVLAEERKIIEKADVVIAPVNPIQKQQELNTLFRSITQKDFISPLDGGEIWTREDYSEYDKETRLYTPKMRFREVIRVLREVQSWVVVDQDAIVEESTYGKGARKVKNTPYFRLTTVRLFPNSECAALFIQFDEARKKHPLGGITCELDSYIRSSYLDNVELLRTHISDVLFFIK